MVFLPALKPCCSLAMIFSACGPNLFCIIFCHPIFFDRKFWFKKWQLCKKSFSFKVLFLNLWLPNTVFISTTRACQKITLIPSINTIFIDNYLHGRFHLLESICRRWLVVEFVHLSDSTFPHSMFFWRCFSPLDFAPIWITTLSGRKNKWFTPPDFFTLPTDK